jgi:hypothetical protein
MYVLYLNNGNNRRRNDRSPRDWHQSLRNVDSIAKFKAELRKLKDINQVPKDYEIGPRKHNIILTQLRCFASFLNYDFSYINMCRLNRNRE